MKTVLHVLLFIWTLPISLGALLNRKERLEDFEGRQVWTYRFWFQGFATAFWPYVLVPSARTRNNIKLLHHENCHLKQQAWFGVTFLPLYGLFFVVLFVVFGFQWRKAYEHNPFEIWARRYADRRVS